MMEEHSKIFEILKHCTATKKMANEFVELIDFLDVRRFRRNLRALAFYFISAEHENLTDEFQEFLEELPLFFDFLDLVEDELSKEKTV